MFDESFSYQEFASYLVCIIVICIIILIFSLIFKTFSKVKEKKRINTIEKDIQNINEELKRINQKLDLLYNRDCNDFVEQEKY